MGNSNSIKILVYAYQQKISVSSAVAITITWRVSLIYLSTFLTVAFKALANVLSSKIVPQSLQITTLIL